MILLWLPSLCSQNSNAEQTGTSHGDPAPTTAPRTVSGRVINAVTGAPVPRALVNLSSRIVLTNAEGKFSFPEFTATVAYTQVSKPGYAATPTPETPRQSQMMDLDSPVELKLYPDALLTGLVTGPDGLPLSRIQVQLSRLSFDSAGPRWFPIGGVQTDSHGAYRFYIPAGRYRITTAYAAQSVERGEAVLPVAFPPSSSSITEAFQLAAGDQRHIDLRPRVSPVYTVAIAIEGAEVNPNLIMTASTATGGSFIIPSQRNGDGLTVQLPTGTFALHAAVLGDPVKSLMGESRVVVTQNNLAPVPLQLAPRPVFPIEAAFEFAPSSIPNIDHAIPTLQQFNLVLHDIDYTGQGYFSGKTQLTSHPDQTGTFNAAPGRYRLGGNDSGAWHLRSASSGVNNLLSETLVVAQGSAGSPIRLVFTNATGRLKGIITMAGRPATGWVYLIALQPSLNAYEEIYVQSDGKYFWSGPPGKYLAVPSAQTVHEDFRNAAFLRKFTTGAREVEITNDSEASLDLTLAEEGVAR